MATPATGSAPTTAAAPLVPGAAVAPAAAGQAGGMGAAPVIAVPGQAVTGTPPPAVQTAPTGTPSPVTAQPAVPPPSTGGFPSPRGPTMRGPYQGAISPTMPFNQVPGVTARPAPPMPPPVASQPVKGLPADAPPLVINGGVYSANPKNRLVIINGQVVREGASLGSGVTLEQIDPAAVVVAFRGAKYRLSY